VVTFADASSIEGWSNVDDTVMGGVSASTTSWESGRLVFAGDLSLENNGGFASVRGPIDPVLGEALSGATALAIDAEGDGRTYVLQLRTADESLYISRFATTAGTAGESDQYVLPLADFEPVTRFLEPSPSTLPLDAGMVVQLAVYVLDAQKGSFRLSIAGIGAQ
jgi:NADH dehydrogenase [ubiquinone] 1 alpha subcomplex assembly factor 1